MPGHTVHRLKRMASSRLWFGCLNNLSPNFTKLTLIDHEKRAAYAGLFCAYRAFRQMPCRGLSNYGGGGNTPFRRAHAQELIIRMSPDERAVLLEELQSFKKAGHERQQEGNGPTADIIPRPNGSQLFGVVAINAIPFIGFGFLDNFIMIVAGDYIDLTIGVTLGISTMAAAALGNLISDVAGVGSAWYVESLSAKVGVKPPVLTPEQLAMGSTTWCTYLGRALGVSIGCFLGMVPLLFLHPKERGSNPDS